MKQGLQLRFSQNLSLTPQLQQAIRLLHLSSQELNQEIELLMQTNPLLEREEVSGDDFSGIAEEAVLQTEDSMASVHEEASEVDATADTTEYQAEFNDEFDEFSNGSRWDENNIPDEDDSDYKAQETLQISLSEHLLSQLKLMSLSERDQSLTALLVDSINDDGYLEASLEEILLQVPSLFEVDLLELQTALRHIQHLDPVGVGARNLSECLQLQLEVLPKETPYLALAQLIVRQHLSALGARDFVKLRKILACDEVALKQAQQLIIGLNPRPGNFFATMGSEHYIQHEVVVKKIKGAWIASLNESVMPKLRINQLYAEILKRNRDSSNQYLQSQMQEAKWMIKNVQQRFVTILRVAQVIVDRQRNFLEYGAVAMRPLVLREIAEVLDLHESTISRITNNKYMLTPRGIFELKYFFGSAVATDSGGTCSATAIRALIKQMVEEENPRKPYSDSQITELLATQGIVVARRTIAKYRESLNVAPASLRKSL